MIHLTIDGKEYTFEEVDESLLNKSFDLQVAKENLLLFKQVMDERGVTFSLAFGTLLGAYREHDFIAHDTDIDVVVPDEDALICAIPYLQQIGLPLIRIVEKDQTYSFMRNGVHIDAYVMRNKSLTWPLSWWYTKLSIGFIPKKILRAGYKPYDFLETTFLIPTKTESFLIFYYGKQWRVPKKDDKGIAFPSIIMLAKKIAQKTMPRKWRLYILGKLKVE